MRAGVPREIFPGQNQVAVVPDGVAALRKAGLEVLIQAGAGNAAGYPDSEYLKQGAELLPSREQVFAGSDIILQFQAAGASPENGPKDYALLREGQALIAFLDPLSAPEQISELATRGITAFSMELIPRSTRAQSMDALSAMATVAGYKAVILAATHLTRMFPLMMTAAGTVNPARVLVIGAGVAGLQAIASARRLGAVVQAYDVRPAVREQVESLGGKFVEMELDAASSETKGGYAREMGEDFYRRQRELMDRVVAESHVVITTAAVPGKKAPVLVTADMVRKMAPGSVIVDLAAERGGNCELTQTGKTIVLDGVTVIGPVNLPSTVPYHASQMYSKNIVTFLKHLVREGSLNIDMNDEITSETLVSRDREITNARVRELLNLPALEPVRRERA